MRNQQCSVLDCGKSVVSRTYCKPHYRKFVFLPAHPLYSIWRGILAGGIEVSERWRQSYRAFATDVGLRPSPRHSLIRINDNGIYEPGNVQWANPVQRSISKGISLRNNTGIKGVYWDETYQRFHSTITINGRRHHLGRYKTLPAAARARYLAEARYTV